ncbi:KGGVGR-motif variant AAA ATPase [Agrobacterium vitis]
MPGTVVTFYSYKGGVGRSFALTNVATILGRWGFRVLCIDWDLEAPGLEDFFRPYLDLNEPPIDRGVVELLTGFAKTRQVRLDWRPYVQRLKRPDLQGVEFIKAGHYNSDYMQRLQKLNWEKLYKLGLGETLEAMFDELREEYDFVLIDSRTGVTDFSGIVTAQLPDILAFLFTANEQSLGGATAVARRAAAIRNDIAIDRSQLLLLPIPARFESQVEHYISSTWRNRFASSLPEFYEGWASKDASIEKLILASTIPYVPFWSFGERIAAIEDNSYDNSSINFSMENIAALLAHRLGQTRLLVESRDEFVAAARRLGRNRETSIFISYSKENEEVANVISRQIAALGIKVETIDSAPINLDLRDTLNDAISSATHFVMLLGRNSTESKFQMDEARTFLRQAASDESERLFLPFVSPDVQGGALPQFIRQYQYHTLDSAQSALDLILERIQPAFTKESLDFQLTLTVTSDGDLPVESAQVCALAENGTTLDTETDEAGMARMGLAPGRSYRILIAHPNFEAKVIDDFKPGKSLNIRSRRGRDGGSLIIQSVGYIPGLDGRLNPLRDTSDRTYLYAENIAVEGGKRQPVEFQVNEAITLEDSQGALYRVVVRLIEGRTTLIDYQKISKAAGFLN